MGGFALPLFLFSSIGFKCNTTKFTYNWIVKSKIFDQIYLC